jgi:antitoxin component YwqK of YwqJK toxin-antitoxin module
MKRYHLSFAALLLAVTLSGQNALDNNGQRTGRWQGFYPDGKLRYEAEFLNGKPVGTTKRFDEKGNLSASMHFYPGTDRCLAEMYAPNGRIIARGVYEAQKKDSTWTYLRHDGSVSLVENYNGGSLSGPAVNYFPSGSISQQLHYSAGKKSGPWIRFFENGDTLIAAGYTEGKLHGSYTSYYTGGSVSISGTYHNDLKDGEWIYFSEDGEILSVIRYNKGDILNPEELEKSYEKFIRSIEENTGNFPDPDITPH